MLNITSPARAAGHAGTLRPEFLGRTRRTIPDRHLMARLEQVGGDALTHTAEADETDAHVEVPPASPRSRTLVND